MPTLAASHFMLDLPTLFAVTFFVTVVGGLLLLFTFLQNRNTPALALWGTGYLVGATGAALIGGAGAGIPNAWSVCAANALVCGAYAFMWSGARSFEGRRVSIALLVAGPAIWIVAFQFDGFAQSMTARIGLVSTISATYALLSACELWYARDRDLISRWPTLLLVIGHAGFLLARIAFAPTLAASTMSGHTESTAVTVIAFEALFAAFCLPFLRVAMSKERAEFEQRKAALTDSLTGVANRRAFFDHGNPLLEGATAERRPVALLLFDLDRFKEINDSAGHQARAFAPFEIRVADRVLALKLAGSGPFISDHWQCANLTAQIRPDALLLAADPSPTAILGANRALKIAAPFSRPHSLKMSARCCCAKRSKSPATATSSCSNSCLVGFFRVNGGSGSICRKWILPTTRLRCSARSPMLRRKERSAQAKRRTWLP